MDRCQKNSGVFFTHTVDVSESQYAVNDCIVTAFTETASNGAKGEAGEKGGGHSSHILDFGSYLAPSEFHLQRGNLLCECSAKKNFP